MKKLLSIFVCFALFLTFTACKGKNDENNNTSKIDLEYYAKIGKMPEIDFTLGDDVDDVIAKLTKKQNEIDAEHQDDPDHSHTHDQAEFIFNVIEGEKNVLIDNGVANYYYNKNNKDKGISYIVNYDTAFGIEKGALVSEVQSHLTGYELKQIDATKEEIFFASYITDATVLRYEIKNVVIMFVFQENQLYATAMYDVNNWKF